MTTKPHSYPTREELIAALLWLRNHYDHGQPKFKVRVLRVVDAIIDAELPHLKDMKSFREAFMRGIQDKPNQPEKVGS